VIDGTVTQLVGPRPFNVNVLNFTTLPAKDRNALTAFQAKVAELTRTLQGTVKLTEDLIKRTAHIKQALVNTPGGVKDLMAEAKTVEAGLDEVLFALKGHEPKASWEEVPPGHYPLQQRIQNIVYAMFSSTSSPGKSLMDSYEIVKEELASLLTKLKKIAEEDLKKLEKEMDAAGAPWTPGRVPELK